MVYNVVLLQSRSPAGIAAGVTRVNALRVRHNDLNVTVIDAVKLPQCKRSFSCWERIGAGCSIAKANNDFLRAMEMADEVVVPLDLSEATDKLASYSCADVRSMLKAFELCLSSLTWRTVVGADGIPRHPMANPVGHQRKLTIDIVGNQEADATLIKAQMEWIKTINHFDELEINGGVITQLEKTPEAVTIGKKVVWLAGSSRGKGSHTSPIGKWFCRGLGQKPEIIECGKNGNGFKEDEILGASQKINDADVVVITAPNILGNFPARLIDLLNRIEITNNKPRKLVLIAGGGFPQTEARLFGLDEPGLFALMKETMRAFCQKHNIEFAATLEMPLSELQGRIGLGKKFRAYLAGLAFAKKGEIGPQMMKLFNWPRQFPLWFVDFMTGKYFSCFRRLLNWLGIKNGCLVNGKGSTTTT